MGYRDWCIDSKNFHTEGAKEAEGTENFRCEWKGGESDAKAIIARKRNHYFGGIKSLNKKQGKAFPRKKLFAPSA